MTTVLDAPAVRAGEQRQAHRFLVAEERQATLVEIRGQRYDARVVDESASGLLVVVFAPLELTIAMQVLVYCEDAWLPAEVVRTQIRDGETIVGLRRLEEEFDPEAIATRDFQIRDLMPAGIFFWLVAAVLVALVVVVVLSPTPEPQVAARRSDTGGFAPTVRADSRSITRSQSVPQPTKHGKPARTPVVRRPKPKATEPADAAKAEPKADPVEPREPSETTPRESPGKTNDGAGRAPWLAIFADPEVADELELSEEQRRRLDELEQQTPADELPEAVLDVLTPEQRQRLEQRAADGAAAS
ncbi:MAG: PilZ domain-containing protein [Pirellulales bacterium]|nr:PilZ domain-containing protein [Pirellulales bacterium]